MNIDSTESTPTRPVKANEAALWTPPPFVRCLGSGPRSPRLLSPLEHHMSLEKELDDLKLKFLQEYHKPRGTPERGDKIQRVLSEYSQKHAVLHMSPSPKTPPPSNMKRDLGTEQNKCNQRIRLLQKDHTLIYRLMLEQYDKPDTPTRRHIVKAYTMQLRQLDRELKLLRAQCNEIRRARADQVKQLKAQRVKSEREAYFQVSLKKFHSEGKRAPSRYSLQNQKDLIDTDEYSEEDGKDLVGSVLPTLQSADEVASLNSIYQLHAEVRVDSEGYEYSSSSSSSESADAERNGHFESEGDNDATSCACKLF